MSWSKGFSLLELLIVVVIIGVLCMIVAPGLLNASDYAREGAVKANVSAAASTVITHLTVESKDAITSAADAADQLNEANSPDDPSDDAKSPFNSQENAYVADSATTIGGQTTLDGAEDEYVVVIKGWNKQAEVILAQKAVSAIE